MTIYSLNLLNLFLFAVLLYGMFYIIKNFARIKEDDGWGIVYLAGLFSLIVLGLGIDLALQLILRKWEIGDPLIVNSVLGLVLMAFSIYVHKSR